MGNNLSSGYFNKYQSVFDGHGHKKSNFWGHDDHKGGLGNHGDKKGSFWNHDGYKGGFGKHDDKKGGFHDHDGRKGGIWHHDSPHDKWGHDNDCAPEPKNSAPETDNICVEGKEDSAGIPVILSGSDSDGRIVQFTLNDLPVHGTLYNGDTVLEAGDIINATDNTATVLFVPELDFDGKVTFHYAAKDDDGSVDHTPATATITVEDVPSSHGRYIGDDDTTEVCDDTVGVERGDNVTLTGGAQDVDVDSTYGETALIDGFDDDDTLLSGGIQLDNGEVLTQIRMSCGCNYESIDQGYEVALHESNANDDPSMYYVFEAGGNTFVFADNGDVQGELDDRDFAVELVGQHDLNGPNNIQIADPA
ncbi:hypothetical protein [Halomonas sp. WWR20]